jgi:CheY-like chemotaxis protein
MPSEPHSPELMLLRPIRVIVVSRDERFASVFRFLLGRKQLAVKAASRRPELLALLEQGADVVVIDATHSLADAARTISELEGLHPEIGVIVVSERRGNSGSRHRLMPKWGPLQQLIVEIERTYLHLPARAPLRALDGH